MLEAFEFKGLWYLPEKPDEKVAGILKYTPNEKICLELIGTFTHEDNNLSFFFNQSGVCKIIYGETSDGKYLTLFNCYKSGSYNFSCSFPLLNFTVDFVLQGYYLESFEGNFFDYIEIGVPDLDKWIGRNTHNLKMQFADGKVAVATFELSEKNNFIFRFEIDEETELELYTGSFFSGANDSYNIRQEAYYRVHSKVKLNISSFIKKAQVVNSFISVGVLQNVPFNYIKLYNKNLQEAINKDPKQEFPLYLIYPQHERSTLKHTNKILFNFNDIEDNFGVILKKWFLNNDELAPIRNHLFDAISIRRVFKSIDFLILAFAIEGYYLRFRKKDTSLKMAINNILDEFKHVHLIKSININSNQVNDSRNYYAHLFDKNKKSNVLFGKELYDLAEKLKLLLICCMLKEIGFNDEMINQSISRSGLKLYN